MMKHWLNILVLLSEFFLFVFISKIVQVHASGMYTDKTNGIKNFLTVKSMPTESDSSFKVQLVISEH